MTKKFLTFGLTAVMSGLMTFSYGQFHTMNIPKSSPKVKETQQLGITNITLEYHSPAVRGRDVWKEIVPFGGEPIAWRAGANMNTRITFSTDVTINGNALQAGGYGFHVVPRETGTWTLIFAHHDNQWGSYYLDRDKHAAIEVEVTPVATNFSEQLDYEFIERTDSTVVIALEWAEKRIPFTIGVDLNKTVLDNFRYELLGINTYRWEAWNDAAQWCLRRKTNLTEALEWANRSINGGYGGFAANKNMSNLSTKADILFAMGNEKESDATYKEAMGLIKVPGEVYETGRNLALAGRLELSAEVFEEGLKQFADSWLVQMGYARTLAAQGDKKAAKKYLTKSIETVPENYKGFVTTMLEKLDKGEAI